VATARQRGFASAVAATLSRGAGGSLLLGLRWIGPSGRGRGQVTATLTRDRAGPVDEALTRLLTPALPAAAPERGERPSPWYRSPWLWGVAGAAIAAAVLVPLAVDAGQPSDFDVRPRGDTP
jgi:hypothetical protein